MRSTPDSSKRLHIHAVPSSSTPARPFLDTPPGDPHASQRAACLVSEPRELQLRSPCSFQRYVMNPYQLSRLIFSPLDFSVVVMFLMQRCPLQPRTGVPVCWSQSSLECGHILAHRAFFLLRTQGCPIHSLDRKFANPASSCWGSLPCLLVASPGSSSGLGARARPTPASSLGTPPSGTGPAS